MSKNPQPYFPPFPSRPLTLLLLSLSLALFVSAQDQSGDSTRTLSVDLDTTILYDPPAEGVKEQEEDTDIAKEDEEKKEYFLPVITTASPDDSIFVRKIPADRREAMRRDGAFWYANKSFKKKEENYRNSGSITDHPAFQLILWLLIIGCFAAGMILYLSNSNVRLFRRSGNISDTEMEEETDDIFGINYQKEIEKATAAGNFRLAIRLMFLRQLKKLAERNFIQYTHNRTNFDYLLQMRSSTMYPDFFRLTRNYEYSWYGQFDIDAEKFALIRKEFDNFDRKMH